EDAGKGLDDATSEFKERRAQGDALAHRPQQNIKQSHRDDLASHLDEIDGETQLKQASVRQYVGRRSRGVAEDQQSFADKALREYACQDGKEIKHTRHAGEKTRRSFCDPSGHCSSSNESLGPYVHDELSLRNLFEGFDVTLRVNEAKV